MLRIYSLIALFLLATFPVGAFADGGHGGRGGCGHPDRNRENPLSRAGEGRGGNGRSADSRDK